MLGAHQLFCVLQVKENTAFDRDRFTCPVIFGRSIPGLASFSLNTAHSIAKTTEVGLEPCLMNCINSFITATKAASEELSKAAS